MPADPGAPDGPARPVRPLRRVAWICTYTYFLLLAVRWCARTYPGWYFPDSAFLNDLLNGGDLFTLYGYDCVLLAAAAALARILLAGPDHPRAAAALRLLHWASLAIVALILCYGLYWAQLMERLPWQEDGLGRF